MLGSSCIAPPRVESEHAWMSVDADQLGDRWEMVDAERMHVSQLLAVREGSTYKFQYVW